MATIGPVLMDLMGLTLAPKDSSTQLSHWMPTTQLLQARCCNRKPAAHKGMRLIRKYADKLSRYGMSRNGSLDSERCTQ